MPHQAPHVTTQGGITRRRWGGLVGGHASIGGVTGDVRAAAARLAEAEQAVAAARDAVVQAQDRVRLVRGELHAAVVAAAGAGVAQVAIAAAARLSREQVRRICRAAGVG